MILSFGGDIIDKEGNIVIDKFLILRLKIMPRLNAVNCKNIRTDFSLKLIIAILTKNYKSIALQWLKN